MSQQGDAREGAPDASRIALGTAQFGLDYGIANQNGQVTQAEAAAMLALAAERGVDTLDTAIAYGNSEDCLGAVGCARFNVVSKLPAIPSGCADVATWVDEQVAGSLARLKVGALHGLLLHRPAQLLDADGPALYAALERQRAAGRIGKLGVSIYAPTDLDALSPRYRFDLVQAPYNVVDRRIASSGWLARLKEQGTEVHTRSAFLQGLLLLPPEQLPAHFAPWAETFERWHAWLATHAVSAVDACLDFVLAEAAIDRVIVGADSVQQLRQTLAGPRAVPAGLPDLSSEAEQLINPGTWSLR